MSCHVSFFFMNCYFHHLQILNSFLKINLLIVVVLKLQLVILRCVVGGLFFELNFNCVHFLLFLFCSCFALVRFDLFRCVLLVSCLFLTNFYALLLLGLLVTVVGPFVNRFKLPFQCLSGLILLSLLFEMVSFVLVDCLKVLLCFVG